MFFDGFVERRTRKANQAEPRPVSGEADFDCIAVLCQRQFSSSH
jgi:hypothetical protein